MEWQIVALAGLFVALVLGVRFTAAMHRIVKGDMTSKVDEARNILENRYALGEIDHEEFAHRLKMLADERERDLARRDRAVDD